ncbi:hypothetical protein D3C85_869410 [compost metagenome]
MQHQRTLGRHPQLPRFQGDGDAGIEQRRVVRRIEGVEAVRVHLLAAVAAIELIVEKQRHLVDRVVGRDVEGVEQVLLAVGAQLGERDLGAGDDDRLVQIFEHEGEGRGGERHGVGAVQDHEAVVLLVVVTNVLGDALPVRRGHVGGVDEGGIFVNMIIRHLRPVELGHPRQTIFHETRHRHITVVGTLHPYGAARVGDIDRLLHTLSSLWTDNRQTFKGLAGSFTSYSGAAHGRETGEL